MRRPSGKKSSTPRGFGNSPNLPAPQAQTIPPTAPEASDAPSGPAVAQPASSAAPALPAEQQSGPVLSLLDGMSNPDAQPRAVVVHLHSATNLPRLAQLHRTSLSPYATMHIVNSEGVAVGDPKLWAAPPQSTRDPVWNYAQDMRLPALTYRELQDARLHIELWDDDGPLLPPNLIGRAEAPLLSLIADEHIPVPLTLSPLATSDAAEGSASPTRPDPPGTPSTAARSDAVTVGEEDMPSPLVRALKLGFYALADPWEEARLSETEQGSARPPCVRVRLVRAYPPRKRLYVVRHGESEWNKAQSALDLGSMYSQVDHPLSSEGRRQAEALAERLAAARQQAQELAAAEADGEVAALRDMCAASLVMSSPLTRALQTCLIGLGPMLRGGQGRQVYLVPNARERLNPGSADSFGCAVGATEVLERAVAKTADANGGDTAAAREVVAGVALDDVEVRSRWWSTIPESKDGVNQRMAALLQQIQYAPSEAIILVGHSHFLRELMKANLHADFVAREPALAAQLKKLKLSNCGVARIDLDFTSSAAPMVGVRLLADTQLVS